MSVLSPSYPEVPWLLDWRRTGVDPQAQREYVAQELQRIAAAGAPVLTQVLTAPFELQQLIALSVLHNETPIPEHRWYLRLREGASPPLKDAQGRDVMPPEDRGKVLVAKTTTLGGRLKHTHTLPDAVTSQWNGPNQQAAAVRGRDIYSYVRIGRTPVAVSLADAICVLNKWGVGIPMLQTYNRNAAILVPGPGGTPVPVPDPSKHQDAWLVEEVPPEAADELLRAARADAKPKGGKPAAPPA
jgi:hypothetical protein